VIDVKDAEKFAEFYRRVFELKKVGPRADVLIELAAGGCNLAFRRSAKTADPQRAASKIIAGTRDVAETKRTLTALGLRLRAIHRSRHSNFCNRRDPEGNHPCSGDRGIP
jgi:catechol 2,3-dioxygenase-like lactoylglutathione lyase family enzyme